MALFVLLLITALKFTCGSQWASYYDVMTHDQPSHLRAFRSNFAGHYRGPPNPQFCPAPPRRCRKSKYRTLDGTCNNLVNPTWGAAMQQFARLLPAKYSDGVAAPTVSVTGKQLPSPRAVSAVVFKENDAPDPEFTLVNMQWGQILSHDMSRTADVNSYRMNCCSADGKLLPKEATHPACFPIHVPRNDPVHSHTGTECFSFVRSRTDRDSNCPTQKSKAEQLSEVTAYMDMSFTYGSNDEELRALRTYKDGRLLVDYRLGQEWPPQNPNASTTCDGPPHEPCYLAGDERVNQNPGLTVLQVVLLREHNFLAKGLKSLNPHWNDEKLFQEARRVNVAQFQHVTYWEWLPLFLGEDNPTRNHHNDYNEHVNAAVLNEHATAAFRYFHSQIEGRLDLKSEARSTLGSLRLSDWFNRPVVLESGNNLHNMARCLTTQSQELTDINFDREIKQYLNRNGRQFGTDLRAIDFQRNRDHSLASYNDLREFCGLPRASEWEDFLDLLSPETVGKLKSLYASHEDVDLSVGGSLEEHVDGTLVGPTFLCILTDQFYRTRVGDRFFYEHASTDVAFTPEQLDQIREVSVARLFCNNLNQLHAIQPRAFRKLSMRNHLVPCNQIPHVDLTPWKEHY